LVLEIPIWKLNEMILQDEKVFVQDIIVQNPALNGKQGIGVATNGGHQQRWITNEKI
jgi:hypothetical protein